MTYGLSSGIAAAAAAVGMLLITRELTPAEYGALTLSITVVTLITSFGSLGISNGIQYYFLGRTELSTTERNAAVSGGVLAALVSVVLSIGIVEALAKLTLSDSNSVISGPMLVTVGALAFTWSIGQILQDLRRLHFQLGQFAATAALRAIVGTTLGVILVSITALGSEGYLLGLLVGGTLALALAAWFARNDFHESPTLHGTRRVVSYSWPLALAGGAAWVGSGASLWVLQWAGGAEQVGIYGLALRFGSIMGFVVASVSQAWSPRVLHAWARGEGFDSLIARFSIIWSGVLLATFALALPTCLWFVHNVAGVGFSQSAQLVPITMLTFSLQGLVTFTAIGLTLARRTRTIAALAWAASIFGLTLSFVLAPALRSWGVAVALLASQILLVILYAAYSRRALQFEIPYIRVAIQWIVGAILTAIVTISQVLDNNGVPVLATASCFVCVFGYLGHVAWEVRKTRPTP